MSVRLSLCVATVILDQQLWRCQVSFLKECQRELADGDIGQRQKGLGSHDSPVARDGVSMQTLGE